jgi:inner membrane protein
MEQQNTPPITDQVSSWFRTSVTVKIFIICFLALVLLIPANMVQLIISEREQTGRSVEAEVEKAWAGNQHIAGPVLSVPYYKMLASGEKQYHTKNFLPQQLGIGGKLLPEELHRSIYEITVYDADLKVNGVFDLNTINSTVFDGVPLWQQSYFTIGIADMSGIQNNITVQINNNTYPVRSGTQNNVVGKSGITVPIDLQLVTGDSANFNFDLQLQGTGEITFVPLGNYTKIDIQSDWASPGFTGAFSPDEKNITRTGFTAGWEILELNRNYPQVWDDEMYNTQVKESSFGVNLVRTTDDYQKSTRSVKYAILVIGLTFLVFFLVEIMNGKRIHPFQYTLVGFALCIFYVLLISISEHLEFNLAYFISAGVVILMITLYALAIFKSKKLTSMLFIILTGLYGFIFVLLQASDYALLMGSAGLVVTLSLTMYLTRNINWYSIRPKAE